MFATTGRKDFPKGTTKVASVDIRKFVNIKTEIVFTNPEAEAKAAGGADKPSE